MMYRAHPRSRGENLKLRRLWGVWWGSSPLTRGKRRLCPRCARIRGLIPAHAGKTSKSRSSPTPRRAHPRSRGENRCHELFYVLHWGSSPLTRGKRGPPGRWRGRSGLIPAHAGKTTRLKAPATPGRAHPRSRGENSSSPSWRVVLRGSSPLTRGKPGRGRLRRHIHGLIPAHAGKTLPLGGADQAARAHPRSRGENTPTTARPLTVTGSSPLTRGKPITSISRAVRPGLIPAHAGKTDIPDHWQGRRGAHPRSRGENRRRYCIRGPDPVAHPRSRGENRRRSRPATSCLWLIPAHAGKTRPKPRGAPRLRAHPRSRGENFIQLRRLKMSAGSSPLTRGKQCSGASRDSNAGLIPAHAGKTRPSSDSSPHSGAHPRSRGENAAEAASVHG